MEKLQLEKGRLAEHGSASSKNQQMALSQAYQENAVAKTKAPALPGFADGKYNLDSFLLRFERFATGWR